MKGSESLTDAERFRRDSDRDFGLFVLSILVFNALVLGYVLWAVLT